MKFAQFLAFAVAIAASALAVSLSSDYMASMRVPQIVQVAPKVDMTTVVVSAQPIAHGRIIKPEHLREMQWPANAVPEGAFQSIIEILGTENDRLALSRFTAGEVITNQRISGPGQRPSLALMLDPGMRAIAVRVNTVLCVGGFVMPGDRVDMLLTERTSERAPDKIRSTEVLLRDVRVLAIDQQIEDPEYKPRVASTVTLEVALHAAQKIALATTVGSISLALRSAAAPREPNIVDVPKPVVAERPIAKIEDPTRKIVVFRSAKATEYKVPHVSASIFQ